MFCTQCGKQINDDSRFCKYCGAPITTINAANEKISSVTVLEKPQPAGSKMEYSTETVKTNDNTEKENHVGKTLGLLGGVMAAIGSLLPVLTVSVLGAAKSGNLYVILDHNLFLIALAVIGLATILLGAGVEERTSAICGAVITIGFSIYVIVETNNSGYLNSIVSFGPGLYLYLFGGILGFIGGLSISTKNQEEPNPEQKGLTENNSSKSQDSTAN